VVTAKFVAVLEALLWGFDNAATGRCFPSYERIAERADCARSLGYIQLYVGDRNFSRVIGGLTLTAANCIQFGLGEFSVIEVGSVVGVVGVVHDFSP
jgi:hypothetical protein